MRTRAASTSCSLDDPGDAAAGGNVIIPTFAIERAQDLMFHLSKLVHARAIPPVPVYLDSPMAREVTRAFERHDEFFDAEARRCSPPAGTRSASRG